MKTCLIGGLGFIGRALSDLLLKEGRELVIVDIAEPKDQHQAIEYKVGDYGNKGFLRQALAGVDEIVLLAYASVPKTSFEDPLADITNNLPPALSLLEVAKELPIKKLVILSSGGTVYGKVTSLPINEQAPTNPISPYGITKLAIEKYASMYHELYSLPTVILRPGNAYGEGQRPFTGQGFIATAIASILEGKELIVYGETGTIRDYVHINDIATAILAALDRAESGEYYNVGTGRGVSNKELISIIDILASRAGYTTKLSTQPERAFDVPANILDATKLTQVSGWQPAVQLEDGVKRTWNWFYEAAKG